MLKNHGAPSFNLLNVRILKKLKILHKFFINAIIHSYYNFSVFTCGWTRPRFFQSNCAKLIFLERNIYIFSSSWMGNSVSSDRPFNFQISTLRALIYYSQNNSFYFPNRFWSAKVSDFLGLVVLYDKIIKNWQITNHH